MAIAENHATGSMVSLFNCVMVSVSSKATFIKLLLFTRHCAERRPKCRIHPLIVSNNQ